MIIEVALLTFLTVFGWNMGAANEHKAGKHEIACNQQCEVACSRGLLAEDKIKGKSYFYCLDKRFWLDR